MKKKIIFSQLRAVAESVTNYITSKYESSTQSIPNAARVKSENADIDELLERKNPGLVERNVNGMLLTKVS